MSLVERDETMARLTDLLAGAVAGRGVVVLVDGAVAVGKSELLRAFAERSLDLGALPVTATGSRMGRDLPLGVLGQLVQDAPLARPEREKAAALLGESAGGVRPGRLGSRADVLQQVDAQVVHGLCTILLELAERCPLLIVVDDVHHADPVSLLCLAYLSRLAATARIMMLFAQGPYDALFSAELLRQPHCRRIRLAPLSRAGIAAVVAERLGRETAESFAEEWHEFSGGNPLLAAALAEDYRDATRSGDRPPGVVVGRRYGRAVLACLHRAGRRTLKAAQGLAVLAAPGRPEDSEPPCDLARLLGLGAADVDRELRALATGGLIRGGRFRHEAARTAVLAEMDAGQRMGLHARAAALAHETGAPPSVIADHLLEAGPLDEPWVVPVLEEAARTALRTGRVRSAVACLRRAWRECVDEDRRARITMMLVRAEWRVDPGACTAHLAGLADMTRRGGLRGSDAVALARALLWHGRFDDARDVLEHLDRLGAAVDPETYAELVVTRLWLRATFPPLRVHLRRPDSVPGAVVSPEVNRRLESAVTLAEVLSGRPCGEGLDAVERILRACHRDGSSTDTLENALLALAYGGRCDRAASWCELFRLRGEHTPESERSPSRQARLAAVHAEIAVRRRDMRGAERDSRLALEIIPESSWGVAVGGPLSSLVLALTAQGRHEEAEECLGAPVAEAMFQTRYGLHYLHARGCHHMATGRPAAALRDFRLCGDLMAAWDLDVPGLVPWCSGAATARPRAGRPVFPPEPPEPVDLLSGAERRVAALAAAGHTNREIAGKLYITVSTVEQHLTRAYRKLRITRRADLPPALRSSAGPSADSHTGSSAESAVEAGEHAVV
ncbi:AAA family ATPase [Sphaerimonospora sp. CA-214678]|uniref:AAA family ATPase n=1 Tax=Sphaerimonospora sp. CA-214678 TaxID=3240029 RepID=UPI003D9239A9